MTLLMCFHVLKYITILYKNGGKGVRDKGGINSQTLLLTYLHMCLCMMFED